MHANVQVQLFPDKIFPLTLSRLLANIPEISLTAVKFPDISRFSIQVVTLQTVLRELAYGQHGWLMASTARTAGEPMLAWNRQQDGQRDRQGENIMPPLQAMLHPACGRIINIITLSTLSSKLSWVPIPVQSNIRHFVHPIFTPLYFWGVLV